MTFNISDNAEKKKMKNTKKNKRIRQFHRPPTVLLNRYAPVIDNYRRTYIYCECENFIFILLLDRFPLFFQFDSNELIIHEMI